MFRLEALRLAILREDQQLGVSVPLECPRQVNFLLHDASSSVVEALHQSLLDVCWMVRLEVQVPVCLVINYDNKLSICPPCYIVSILYESIPF